MSLATKRKAESDEEDYMSDVFLAQCSKEAKDDIRPGFAVSHSVQRQKRAELSRLVNRPIKVIQKEQFENGLNTALGSENKGFSMLQKMGYNPGSSLGKDGQGRLEPVAIEQKNDRVGLGWKIMLTQKREEIKQLKRKLQINPEEFRARFSCQMRERTLLKDLQKSQRTCHQFDIQEGLNEPQEKWFWPSYVWKEEEEDEEEKEEEKEELQPCDQLEILTFYLRSSYHYCIWCVVQYDSDDDMESQCPGVTRQAHNE